MIFAVQAHLDEPDVVVRVIPESNGFGPAALLKVGDVALFPNSMMHTLDRQLDMVEKVGMDIIKAVAAARPDIPRVA